MEKQEVDKIFDNNPHYQNKVKRLNKKICLIKTVELTKKGWETKYHTEVDGIHISNSISESQYRAELFFEKVLENNGVSKRKETLREEYR